jgi:hypothetical protein
MARVSRTLRQAQHKNFPSPHSGNQRGADTTKGRIANA